MQAVRSNDTSPELALRRSLFALGVRGWRCHRRDLPGKPDLSFTRARVVVFVDGAFWHGRPDRHWPGRISAYWDAKIARNRDRDRRANKALQAMGWRVVRFWDSDVLSDPLAAAQRVRGFILCGGG
jgi:DNA mismatch endonuclease (patch repair protein)